MNVLLLVVGILLLWVGGELLIRGATALARLWGLSPLVIGLTVVAFGTSAPELAATLAATLRGSPAIAFGNIVGSNIANLGLILGLTALLQPLTTHARFLWREVPFMLAVSLLMTLLMLDGRAGRIEGLLLLSLIVGYLFYLLRTGAEPPEVIAEFRAEYGDHRVRPWKAAAGTAAGILVLVAGADVLVRGAVGIAEALGVPERIVGITLVALGTSLPELASSVVAAAKKQGDIVLGNLIGSNVFNILAILGTTSVVRPVVVEAESARIDLLTMLAFSFLTWPFLASGHRLRRAEGGVLLAAYLGYVVFLVV